MSTARLENRIEELIAPSLESMGFQIVRIQHNGTALQIMAERKDGSGIGTEECAEISKVVSTLLDVEDLIQDRYTLEISSPGLDRPLIRLNDYERFLGFEAKIETDAPIDGRKRFKGRLIGLRDNIIVLETDEGKCEIPFDDIHKGKLVLTDDLLKAASRH